MGERKRQEKEKKQEEEPHNKIVWDNERENTHL